MARWIEKLAKLRSLSRELEVVWDSTVGHRWAAPVLVLLGLGSSAAETLGISLVVLFLYAVIGSGAKAGGLLGQIFNLGQMVSGGNRVALGALILLLIVSKALLSLTYSLLTTHIKNAVSERTRNAVYDVYLAVSYGELRSRDQGALLNTLATESWSIAEAFYAFTRLATNACAIAVFSAFLISIAFPIFLVGLAGAALLYGTSRHLSKPARALGTETLVAMRKLTLEMVNSLQGMRTIRAFGVEQHVRAAFLKASGRVRNVIVRMDRIYSLTAPINEVGYFLLLALIAWTAASLHVSTAATLGAVALLYRLQPHIREFEANRIKLAGMGSTLGAIDAILKLRTKDSTNALPFDGLTDGIRFENVSFGYRGAGTPALDGVSLTIPRGLHTAICGPSGAGKSTLVNLPLGLYEPACGRIVVDGDQLSRLDRPSWLRCVAMAGQDAELFEATIRDNIAIAQPDASDASIAWAARNAGIHDFIMRLPDGYDTWVGERGLNVSGGQRQRIALARAFLRKPQILILDEATNAIDVPLEADIRRNVLDVMRGGTVITITHRPEELAAVDRIIRLSNGHVESEHDTGAGNNARALSRAEA
jgi:subfamily B ATP-binding cassette protein MsbA